MKRYKELRKKQKEYRRGLGHSVVVVSPATAGATTSNVISIDSDPANGEAGDNSTKEDRNTANATNKVRSSTSKSTYGGFIVKQSYGELWLQLHVLIARIPMEF